MPWPLIGALVGAATAAATGFGARIYGEHVVEETEREARNAAREITNLRSTFVLKQKEFADRLSSYVVLLRSALNAPEVPSFVPGEDSLSGAFHAMLDRVFVDVGNVSGIGQLAPFIGLSPSEQDYFKKALAASPNKAQAVPYAAVMAGFAMAKNGVLDAVQAHKFKEEVRAKIACVRAGAEQSLRSLDSEIQKLEIEWHNTIPPNMRAAIGPPRDAQKASLLLHFAATIQARLDEVRERRYEF